MAKSIDQFLLQRIPHSPRSIVRQTIEEFDVSLTTVHRHLARLIDSGQVIKTGSKKGVNYMLATDKNKRLKFATSPKPDEFEVFRKYLGEDFSMLTTSQQDIWEYGFTEIFNNALDHAGGKQISVRVDWQADVIILSIQDDGVGIFQHIANRLNLTDLRESVLHLSKGKLTTMPHEHSGEGIFFCSRVFDSFHLQANGYEYVRDNHEDDWFLAEATTATVGTLVRLELSRQSGRYIGDVFKQYQEPDTLRFAKTEIMVELSRMGYDRYISRSQAKRVLQGLEQFQEITFDFRGVRLVGQGFVDEVFRVFANKHPEKTLAYVNANEAVEFMLQRAIA